MRILLSLSPAAALVFLVVGSLSTQEIGASTFGRRGAAFLPSHREALKPSESLLLFRGGASRRNKTSRTASLSSSKTATGKKKVGANKGEEDKPNQAMRAIKKLLPITRIYLILVVVFTLLGTALGGEVSQSLFALDPIRTINGLQIWRPITAASILGPPSLGWVFNFYYLLNYGSALERSSGTGQHLIFMISQLVLCSACSMLVGQPFFATAMIASMLHVLSRATPYANVRWIIFTVPHFSLPVLMGVTDALQAQSFMALIPHLIGIFCGHFYHFHKSIWPKLQGEDWLAAPAVIANRFDPDAAQESKKTTKRKRTKGRKLGSK